MFIIFDLDDTLIDTSGSITPFQLKRALEFALQKLGRLNEFAEAYIRLMEINQNSLCGRDALTSLLEAYVVNEGLLRETLGILRMIPDSQCTILAMQNAPSVVQALSSHRLAIVTIGHEELQLYKLKKAGFDPSLFSKIVVTEERNKKNHYTSLMREYGQVPQRTIVIGDRVMIDLQPAKELGCRTVRLLKGRGLQIFKTEEARKPVGGFCLDPHQRVCASDGHDGSKVDYASSYVVDHAIEHIHELIAIVESYEAENQG